MSCRAFLGGLAVGAIIGLSVIWGPPQQTVQRAPILLSSNIGRRPTAIGTNEMVEESDTREVRERLMPGQGASSSRTVATSTPTAAAAAAPMATTAVAAPSSESSSSKARRARGSHWSVGKLQALPKAVDIAAPGMARHVVERRSYRNEIILFTSDHQMGGWAYHWVQQMRQWGYEHHFILGDNPGTCETLSKGWEPMVERYGEERLSCVWSSFPWGHPGWEQWKPRHGEDSLHHVYILWASRW